MVEMCVPLYANGFSELDKLIPPQMETEIRFEVAKPSFYLSSIDDTKGVFEIEDMMIVGTYELLI